MSEVTLIRCIGCGTPLGNTVPSEGALKHVLECKKHPLQKRIVDLEEALRPFAQFVFGPGWAGHHIMEMNKIDDTNVLFGYGADGKPSGLEVKYSDFVRAKKVLGE